METLIKIIINISLLLGSSYCAKEFLFNVEKMTVKRIKKGFSSSEQKVLPENSLAQNYLSDDFFKDNI